MTPWHIIVLYGGDSSERDVSLVSGQAVATTLSHAGHHVTLIDAQDDLIGDVRATHQAQAVDAVFIALHGGKGEDGTVQAILSHMQLPYTGANMLSSVLCMNKELTKQCLSHASLPIIPGISLSHLHTTFPLDTRDWPKQLKSYPLFVKPNNAGSSVGCHRIEQGSQLESALRDAWTHSQEALVETCIEGPEVAVGILNGQALGTVEIEAGNSFYDYEAKYQVGKSVYHVPARYPEPLREQLKALALKAARALGCDNACRVDFIINRHNPDEHYILEVNTIPGMTPTSLYPKSAALHGIDFEQLVTQMIRDAIDRHAHID